MRWFARARSGTTKRVRRIGETIPISAILRRAHVTVDDADVASKEELGGARADTGGQDLSPFLFVSILARLRGRALQGALSLERDTGLEPATFALARQSQGGRQTRMGH